VTCDTDTLSDRDFAAIAGYIERETGIRLPSHKRGMVQVRVAKRAREIGVDDFAAYVRFAFGGAAGASERAHLIDAITTNKTDFFREAQHFDYLAQTALPELLDADPELGRTSPLVGWCAACSTGEEPYTLAMVLKSQPSMRGELDFVVHATDICGQALDHARRAVYSEDHARPIPNGMRRAYMLRSRNRDDGLVRVGAEVRSHVEFSRGNLLSDPLPVTREAHIVFCRNVLIYFDRETQVRVLQRVVGSMRPGGYLFVGHSEGLLGFNLPLERVTTSVYRLTR
jgi:chemotaxis protein methyltransferase CheR